MSFYTQFHTEAIVTSTTTSLLTASDPVLIFSAGQGHAAQATVGAINALCAVTSATSLTTATAITAYGMTTVTCPTTVPQFTLTTPSVGGLYKTIFVSSSTSTAILITVASTAAATFMATDTQLGTTFTFSKSGAYVELVSASSSVWNVVGRSAAGAACT